MSRGTIALAGLAIAVAGGISLDRIWHTGGAIADALRLRDAGATFPAARLKADIERLQTIREPEADELGALAFFHYATADIARAGGNADAGQRELNEAASAARRALALSPARADLAVALAEIEFLRNGAGPEVYKALDLSYRTAPRELWIVQRRIGLGLRLIAVAPPGLADNIVSDIHILGEPFAPPEQYQMLAEAAFVAGPAAVATVERELGLGHPWPFGFFEKRLSELRANRAGQLGTK